MDRFKDLVKSQEDELTTRLQEIQQLRNLAERCEIEKKDQFREFVLGIIEVIDTFEKAEEAIKERNLNSTEESSKIINRYNSVMKKLNKLLQRNGVSKLEFPDNRLIVGFCKVVDTEPDPSLQNDSIIEIIRNGYIHGKESIREAEIIIVKN